MDTSSTHSTNAGGTSFGSNSAAHMASPNMQAAADRATSKVHETVDKASESVAPVIDWIAKQENAIASHPLTSVGLAFGAGYLLSQILRIRH